MKVRVPRRFAEPPVSEAVPPVTAQLPAPALAVLHTYDDIVEDFNRFVEREGQPFCHLRYRLGPPLEPMQCVDIRSGEVVR